MEQGKWGLRLMQVFAGRRAPHHALKAGRSGERMRYQILDGFRGFFLIFMFIAHANEQLKTLIGKYSHHNFGWVEDAQGFVFISGLVIGLVYGKRLLRQGVNSMHLALINRQKTIYIYYIFIILSLYFIYIIVDGHTRSEILLSYREGSWRYILTSMMLLSASKFMDILPMYLVFMAFTGLALNAMSKGREALVLAISALMWVMAQSHGYDAILLAIREQAAGLLGGPIGESPHFDLFGWQFIYFLGLYLGFRMARNDLDLSFMKTRTGSEIALFCFVSIMLFLIFKRMSFASWLDPEYVKMIRLHQVRSILSPVYLFAFLVDLYLLTWLIVAGVDSGNKAVRFVGSKVKLLFSSKPLVFLGQHSLQVYSFHIILVYLISIILDGQPVGQLRGFAIIFLGIALLYGVAYLHDKWSHWSKPVLAS
ncbi:MAG: OpgC domain-containing protein [Sphingobium sp.]